MHARFVAAREIERSLPDAVGAYVEWLVRHSGWTVTERRQVISEPVSELKAKPPPQSASSSADASIGTRTSAATSAAAPSATGRILGISPESAAIVMVAP